MELLVWVLTAAETVSDTVFTCVVAVTGFAIWRVTRGGSYE